MGLTIAVSKQRENRGKRPKIKDYSGFVSTHNNGLTAIHQTKIFNPEKRTVESTCYMNVICFVKYQTHTHIQK